MGAVLKLVTVDGRQTVDRNSEAEEVLREVRMELYKLDHKALARQIGVSPAPSCRFVLVALCGRAPTPCSPSLRQRALQ